MTEMGPVLQAVESQLMQAIERDQAHRRRRRKALRAGALTAAAAAVLSGTALAATGALGVIDLGGGVSAARVSTLPEWDGLKGTFVTGGAGTSYIYHLTGGSDPTLNYGPTDPHPTNNIYITSRRRLSTAELRTVLDEELSHETWSDSTVIKDMREGKLPPGLHWVKQGRHPVISGPSSQPATKLPAGVTSVSNGCPTPGVAGQPGTPGSSPASGKKGVAVAP